MPLLAGGTGRARARAVESGPGWGSLRRSQQSPPAAGVPGVYIPEGGRPRCPSPAGGDRARGAASTCERGVEGAEVTDGIELGRECAWQAAHERACTHGTHSGADRIEARVSAPHHAASPRRTHTIEGAPGISLGGTHTVAPTPALPHADSPGCARAVAVVSAARSHAHAGGCRGSSAERETPGITNGESA